MVNACVSYTSRYSSENTRWWFSKISKRVFKHPLQGDGPGCCGAVHTGLPRDRPPSSVAPPDEEKREGQMLNSAYIISDNQLAHAATNNI